MVYEILTSNDGDFKDCIAKLKDEYGLVVPQEREATTAKKIGEIRIKVNFMRKQNKMLKIDEYLSRNFTIPSPRVFSNATLNAQLVKTVETQKVHLKDQQCALNDALCTITEIQNNKAIIIKQKDDKLTDLSTALSTAQTSNQELFDNQKHIEAKCDKLSAQKESLNIRNVNRNRKRQKDQIESLKAKNNHLSSKYVKLDKEYSQIQKDFAFQKEKYISALKAKSRLKERLNCVLINSSKDSMEMLKKKTKEQQEIIATQQQYVDFLENETSTNAPKIISCFENGKYIPIMRDVCIRLLTECNISINKLPRAIQLILTKLAGQKFSQVPSASTLCRLITEGNVIARAHVNHEMSAHADPTSMTGSCLHQDAGTMIGKHYETMQVLLYVVRIILFAMFQQF